MVVLYILGALALLIAAVLFIRVGVCASLGQEVCVWIKIGPITWQILPKAVKPEKEEKKKKKEKKKGKKKPKETSEATEKEDGETEKKKKLDLTFDEIRSALPVLFESLKRGLKRTRQRLLIKPFTLSVTFGGDDPSKVAEMYGQAGMAMWTAMPQLERLVRMPDPRIHLDVDYHAKKTSVEGEVGVSLQIRDAFSILWKFGYPVLKWYLQVRKGKSALKKGSEDHHEKQVEHKGE